MNKLGRKKNNKLLYKAFVRFHCKVDVFDNNKIYSTTSYQLFKYKSQKCNIIGTA